MGMDRGADDSIDTIRCGRLDRKLATSRLKERGELIRNHPDCRHSISQPSFEQLGVGNGCFPKPQQGSDLGTMSFRGSPLQVQRKVNGHLHDELPCDILDNRSIDIGGDARKSAAVTKERQQHGEAEPVGMMLGHDERQVRRRHHPSFGSICSIEYFHFGRFHHSEVAAARCQLLTKGVFCKKLAMPAAASARAFRVPRRLSKRRNVKSDQAGAANGHERAKDFLTTNEMEALLEALKGGRHGVRDYLLALMTYRHGLRVSEAVGLRRDEVNLDQARLWVRRLKNGLSVEQPVAGDELRAIKRYLASRSDALPWLFISERSQPLTRQSVNYLIAAAAARAGLPPVRPHMLRHSCGYYLANKGYDLRLIQDYLGHRDPKHTVHYTRTAASRFEGLWRR
jgi:type 1 fimbriae regulatory protein FimB